MTKPKAKLVGADSNVFNLLNICVQALERDGQKEQAAELKRKVMRSGSYNEALGIMLDYVDAE